MTKSVRSFIIAWRLSRWPLKKSICVFRLNLTMINNLFEPDCIRRNSFSSYLNQSTIKRVDIRHSHMGSVRWLFLTWFRFVNFPYLEVNSLCMPYSSWFPNKSDSPAPLRSFQVFSMKRVNLCRDSITCQQPWCLLAAEWETFKWWNRSTSFHIPFIDAPSSSKPTRSNMCLKTDRIFQLCANIHNNRRALSRVPSAKDSLFLSSARQKQRRCH